MEWVEVALTKEGTAMIVSIEQAMDIFLYDLQGYDKSEYVYLLPYTLEKPLARKSELLRHRFVVTTRKRADSAIAHGHLAYSAPYIDEIKAEHLRRLGLIHDPIVITV